MNAIRILTYIGISFIYYSCSDYESRMIDGGNAIVERIESYIDSVGTTPESLSDIGIAIHYISELCLENQKHITQIQRSGKISIDP